MECLRIMALQLFEVFTGDWAICDFVAVVVTGGAALLALLLLLLLLRGEVRQKALRRPPLQANDMKRAAALLRHARKKGRAEPVSALENLKLGGVEHCFELKPTSGILFRAERASHEWLQQQQQQSR